MVEIDLKVSQEGGGGRSSPKTKRKISKSQSLEEQFIQSLRSTGNELTPWKFETDMNNPDKNTRNEGEEEDDDKVQRKRSVSSLVDELLCDIYSKIDAKRKVSVTSMTCDLSWQDSDCGKYSRRYQLRSTPQQLALKLMTTGK